MHTRLHTFTHSHANAERSDIRPSRHSAPAARIRVSPRRGEKRRVAPRRTQCSSRNTRPAVATRTATRPPWCANARADVHRCPCRPAAAAPRCKCSPYMQRKCPVQSKGCGPAQTGHGTPAHGMVRFSGVHAKEHGHENRKARRWRAGKAHWRKMRSSPRLTLVPNLGGEESAVERHLHQLVDQEITRTCGGGDKHKSPSSGAARFLHRFDKKSQSMGLGCQRREGAGTRSAR